MSTVATYVKKELPAAWLKKGITLAVIGLVLMGINLLTDNSDHYTRFFHLYDVMFTFLTSVGLGALFIVGLEHLVGAYWSVPVRRICEINAFLIPVVAVIGLPLFLGTEQMFHWIHPEGDAILMGKVAYLNMPSFVIRYIAFFGIWTFFTWLFYRNSVKQEKTKDQKITTTNLRLSALFLVLFALTSSFFSIDWVMSLESHWFSTMFGIYYFAGTVMVGFCVLALFTIKLRESGYLHPDQTDSHYYPIANFMFAFNCFWVYIAFCQFMLIWYSGLPEETMYFIPRYEGGYKLLAIFLMIVHFPIPFYVLVGRFNKTRPKVIRFMAWWLLGCHVLDLYWLIMPSMKVHGAEYDPLTEVAPVVPASFNITDLGFLVFAAGVVVTVFNLKARKTNLVPTGDPKLEHGLHWHP